MSNELNLLDVYTDFKNKRINKSSFVKIILPVIEEHENELLRLQAIDFFTNSGLKDKQFFKFFEHLIISDESEKIRNAAINYLSKFFLEETLPLFKWVLTHDPSYICQITLLQFLQKQSSFEIKNDLIGILKEIKKDKFLNQDKRYPNQKYRRLLKSILKSKTFKKFNHLLLSEIIINFYTIKNLTKLLPNVFFELNPESGLIEQLDLSDYLEYEVKGTPYGWKNNIDTLSKIEGLKHLSYLKRLDLSNNILKNVEEIVALKNLTHLNLMNNRISDTENLKYLNALPNLKYLNLEGNPISQKITLQDFKKSLDLVLSGKYLEIN